MSPGERRLRSRGPAGRDRPRRSWRHSGHRRDVPGGGGGHGVGDEAHVRHLEQLLSAKEVVVACGPGGVGKTTTSAALAATAAVRLGGRVLVVTVDPARRLADALGIGGLGNVARQVPDEAFVDAGVRAEGRAVRGHARHERVVGRARAQACAGSGDHGNQILANPLYRNITRRFAQGHDYIAMERLYELHEEGELRPPRRRHAAVAQRARPARRARAHGRVLLLETAPLARSCRTARGS